jgi:hypothetical protein
MSELFKNENVDAVFDIANCDQVQGLIGEHWQHRAAVRSLFARAQPESESDDLDLMQSDSLDAVADNKADAPHACRARNEPYYMVKYVFEFNAQAAVCLGTPKNTLKVEDDIIKTINTKAFTSEYECEEHNKAAKVKTRPYDYKWVEVAYFPKEPWECHDDAYDPTAIRKGSSWYGLRQCPKGKDCLQTLDFRRRRAHQDFCRQIAQTEHQCHRKWDCESCRRRRRQTVLDYSPHSRVAVQDNSPTANDHLSCGSDADCMKAVHERTVKKIMDMAHR